MKPFVIKNEEQYEQALACVDKLMDATLGSAEEADLDVWATLIQAYEDKAHPVPLPDPIEALAFRMEQFGLTRKDLVPYLGSPSRVSEVLARKRPLSLTMMRRLHKGLGIPASSLLGESDAELPEAGEAIEWSRFPVVEMHRRGWIKFPGSPQRVREHAEDLMREFVAPFGEDMALPMCARQHVRDGKQMDPYALCAWRIRVMRLASEQSSPAYVLGTVTRDFMREVARLSYFEDGVSLAREYLAKNGILLAAERHLPKTYLDGAAMVMPDDHPLIALTLRYDRLDNFWFTLAHELAHVSLHLEGEVEAVFDDLEAGGTTPMERDADRLASDALIPESAWHGARLNRHSTVAQIRAFAAELRISPAIVAGRIRHEADDHRILWQMLGKNQVRRILAADRREEMNP